MKTFKFLFICLFIVSCKTIDVESAVFDNGAGSQNQESFAVEIASSIYSQPPEVIYFEMPVFIPEAEITPPAPAAGRQSVLASNNEGVLLPSDYSHAAVVYDYHPDVVYEVYCQPLRVTDVCLEPGEIAVEPPFISDSERWILGGGVSYENGSAVQHIYIKPASSGLSASLNINTSRRVYRLIVRSYGDVYMPVVRWRHVSVLPQNYLPSPLSAGGSDPSSNLDPRFLSFNYRITHSWFKKPYWLPDLVFDDGSKTYIRFPEQVLQREMPAVFENRRNIINYRVLGNLIVIDKLIEELTVKIENTQITIVKKRG